MAEPAAELDPLDDGDPVTMTLEEYLVFEERSELRHEYVGGYVYTMVGANVGHHVIVSNVQVALHLAARGGACRVFRESLRLRTGDDFYYPDVMVVCGEVLAPSDTAARKPCLLVEVRSARTARTDSAEKRRAYQAIPTLRAYLRVDARYRAVDVDVRLPDGTWGLRRFENDGEIPLPCPETVLTFDQIYEGLDLPPVPLRRIEEPDAAPYDPDAIPDAAAEWGDEDDDAEDPFSDGRGGEGWKDGAPGDGASGDGAPR